MKNLWKIILAIGGTIAGILAIFSATKQSKSKKEFNSRVKANNDKLDFITGQTAKVEKEKKITKDNIKKTSTKVKETKSKVKSTKNAKSTISDFKTKYRKK
tara:strand:+ start:203 stop:505 length:303 start_codon:yes stop_codon:yes gene_type:complete